MMNNKLFFISLLISLSVQIFEQDVVPRQAPIDKMSPVEGSLNKDKGDNPEFTKIPIIIDSTEGWEWIDNDKAEDVFETYPLRMDYKKYSSHPQYRVVDKYYDLKEPNLINVVYNSDGKLVRVINIFDSNQQSIYYVPMNGYIGSYTSIVGSTGINSLPENDMYKYINGKDNSLKKAYYIALGRERWGAFNINNINFEIYGGNGNQYFLNDY